MQIEDLQMIILQQRRASNFFVTPESETYVDFAPGMFTYSCRTWFLASMLSHTNTDVARQRHTDVSSERSIRAHKASKIHSDGNSWLRTTHSPGQRGWSRTRRRHWPVDVVRRLIQIHQPPYEETNADDDDQ